MLDLLIYENEINKKCLDKMICSTITTKDTETKHLCFKDYHLLTSNNYTIAQLRSFLKNYRLKTGGTKPELMKRLFSFLYLSKLAQTIQKNVRRHFVKMFTRMRGPALYKRTLCVNDSDFLTMETMTEIHRDQFFSFQDDDKFIYGFDVLSFYNLLKNQQKQNPYNRKELSPTTVSNFNRLLQLSKLFGVSLNVKITDIQKEVSDEKSLEFKILDLFQNINALGNYSEAIWFTSLNKYQLIRFVKELNEIWNYRSQISETVKKQICHPHGNPFRHFNLSRLYSENNLLIIQKYILKILENLIILGVDQDSKSLGAYYVLGALTLVNPQAASALPWLYQSVLYN